jgi:hypothetical protein
MSDTVQQLACPYDLIEVEVGVEDCLLVPERTSE